MQLNITLQLTEKELSTIEEALFISSMQLYDVQYKTNDPEDVEEYNKKKEEYNPLKLLFLPKVFNHYKVNDICELLGYA